MFFKKIKIVKTAILRILNFGAIIISNLLSVNDALVVRLKL